MTIALTRLRPWAVLNDQQQLMLKVPIQLADHHSEASLTTDFLEPEAQVLLADPPSVSRKRRVAYAIYSGYSTNHLFGITHRIAGNLPIAARTFLEPSDWLVSQDVDARSSPAPYGGYLLAQASRFVLENEGLYVLLALSPQGLKKLDPLYQSLRTEQQELEQTCRWLLTQD